jgi:hypothetical protein
MILKLERHEAGNGQSIRWELYGVYDEDEQERLRRQPHPSYSTEVELGLGFTPGTYGTPQDGFREILKNALQYDFREV